MYWIKFNEKTKTYSLTKNEKEVVVGNLEEVSAKALEEGVESSEMELAYKIMNKNNHIAAHFGINGRFIYSE